MISGLDISAAQAPSSIDWTRVKNAGIEFVYVKASEGVGYIDKSFVAHVTNIHKVAIPVGAYHYLRVRHGTVQDADKQAIGFCAVYLANNCELIPMLDCEATGNKGATPAEWILAIRMFRDKVKEILKVDPILYTYPSFWMELGHLATADDIAELKLWVAHYTLHNPIIPAPWKSWKIWQYAADVGVIGTVDGVPGHVDRDKLDGELSEITRTPNNQPPSVDPVEVNPVVINPVVINPVVINPIEVQPIPEPVIEPLPEPPAALSFIQVMIRFIMSLFQK